MEAGHGASRKREAPTQEPVKNMPEYRRLDRFNGTWKTEGRQHSGPIGPDARIAAVEHYEWLAGSRFLIHRFDGRVGDNEASCIEIIGYDAESQSYPVHTFYNNGMSNESRYWERGITWILVGTWPLSAKELRIRCTLVFGDDGDEMTGRWEYSFDGTEWKTFWDVKSRRME